MKYIPVSILSFLFSSCSFAENWGIVSVIALFSLMIILFILTFILIFRKKRQADKSLAKYNNDLYKALAKFDTPEQKIEMLKILIERIENDEKYQKDADWKNKVLVNTYIPLAAQYYKIGDEASTLGICSDIIDIDPDHAMSYYNRGSIFNNMGLYEKALADLTKTIELTPEYASAYNNRGLVYYKLDEYDKAIADYDQAIELEDSAVSYFNRANAYYALGDKENALIDFNQFLKLNKSEDAEFRADIEAIIKKLEEDIKD